MKERVSATIDRETKNLIEEMLKKGNYRNISHLIETAIKKMSEEGKNDKSKKWIWSKKLVQEKL